MNCEIGVGLKDSNEILRCHLLNNYEVHDYNVHRRYRHTTIKLYSHEISRSHHSLEWNILVTLVYSTPDYGVTYT